MRRREIGQRDLRPGRPFQGQEGGVAVAHDALAEGVEAVVAVFEVHGALLGSQVREVVGWVEGLVEAFLENGCIRLLSAMVVSGGCVVWSVGGVRMGECFGKWKGERERGRVWGERSMNIRCSVIRDRRSEYQGILRQGGRCLGLCDLRPPCRTRRGGCWYLCHSVDDRSVFVVPEWLYCNVLARSSFQAVSNSGRGSPT